MPRVLRTSTRPFQTVMHECRDARGNKVQRVALSNTQCRQCGTHLVYVFDNTPRRTNGS
jgi:peptide methionine sulfoxide reductase MsrB